MSSFWLRLSAVNLNSVSRFKLENKKKFTRMFCSANDVLVSLTEKTKVLAQKCTQQLRTTNHSNQHSAKSRFYYINGSNDENSISDVSTINRLKSISKSNNDMHLYDKDKQYDELYKSISPRKVNANALRGKNLATCFHTLTGSLKFRRRKSLPDTHESLSNTCGRNRRKLSASNVGYATTRWYVKVSIKVNSFSSEFATNTDFFFLMHIFHIMFMFMYCVSVFCGCECVYVVICISFLDKHCSFQLTRNLIWIFFSCFVSVKWPDNFHNCVKHPRVFDGFRKMSELFKPKSFTVQNH